MTPDSQPEIREKNTLAISTAIMRVTELARKITARGTEVLASGYNDGMAGVSEADIRSLKTTKDVFSAVLKRSRERPQFVHVQGRLGEKDSEYVILPVERLNEMLEAIGEGYVPITELLAQVGRSRELPLPALPQHGEQAGALQPLQVLPAAE